MFARVKHSLLCFSNISESIRLYLTYTTFFEYLQISVGANPYKASTLFANILTRLCMFARIKHCSIRCQSLNKIAKNFHTAVSRLRWRSTQSVSVSAKSNDITAMTSRSVYSHMFALLWGQSYKTFYGRNLQGFRNELECLSQASLSILV